MVIEDRIYGSVNISSKVLINLINSKNIQRLKGIAQFGIPEKYYHLKSFNRYEHSVGVMLLLKKLGASEEEQVAGLLHDVSHTAFSHVIDWVFDEGGRKEDFQDRHHEYFITHSDIPDILRKYGYDANRIIDYHNFGLLERSIPDLCADRVDYSLREFPANTAQTCLNEITKKNNKIVFKDIDAARIFAKNFLKRQMLHWGGFEAGSRYRLFANVLKQAIKDGTISEQDFWENDDFVIDKLKKSESPNVARTLKALENKSLSNLKKSKKIIYKKFRYVDPLLILNGKEVRLSKIDKEFAGELQKARKRNELGHVLPLVR